MLLFFPQVTNFSVCSVWKKESVAAIEKLKRKLHNCVETMIWVDSYHGNQVPVSPQLSSEHVMSLGKHTDKACVIVLERCGHNSQNIIIVQDIGYIYSYTQAFFVGGFYKT